MEELDARIASGSRAGYVDPALQRVREALARVPENPPTCFPEAVQALWFLFAFQRLCGNWPGVGRIDEMLGPFLTADLAAGRVTLDEAREILAHFWIRGCEWVGAPNSFGGSGDGQFYQNILLSGVDCDGNDVTNEVTYLVLDIVEELGIADWPIAVRISRNTPERLLRRIAEVQRQGSGAVAVYNEETVIAALTRFGYPVREARRFANDGCWEAQIPGETCFRYQPFDALMLLQEVIGVVGGSRGPDGSCLAPNDGASHPCGPSGEGCFPDFEALYAAFRERLQAEVTRLHAGADSFATNGYPSTLISLLERDCLERGRGYFDRGCRYNVSAPHAGGLPDTGNSLLAIQRAVYEEGWVTLPELVACLRADWEGCEELRRRIRASGEFFGNDSAAADAMTRRVFDDFVAAVEACRSGRGCCGRRG